MTAENRVVWHWHQLRHTFACRYLERGGSLAALQRMLGHSTSRMTERYAGLSDEALFADLDRVERRAARQDRPRRNGVALVAPARKGAGAGTPDACSAEHVARGGRNGNGTGPKRGPICLLEKPSGRGTNS